jgi:trans-L-3-hydroxyproline dehydratase
MVISVVDAHTGGEPFRVVRTGVPPIPGETMAAKRLYAERHLDPLRRLLMWEPRGHADMYGGLITEPVTPGAAFGILFMHNDGFSTMCGHGIIAMAMVAVETGMVAVAEPTTTIGIDTPAGFITAWVEVSDGRVGRVRFRNVPSFVLALDREIEVPGHGRIRVDLAFGGAFYGYVDAPSVGLVLAPANATELIAVGRAIKRAVAAREPIHHPLEPSLGFLYGTIFTGPADREALHSRHVCIFADGELDRSPTGTGVSGRAALLSARGQLAEGERIRIESIVGSEFGVRVVERTSCGPHPAIIPEVDGEAFLTGRAEFSVDERDRLGEGFLIGR